MAGLLLRDGGLVVLAIPFLVYVSFGLLQAPTGIELRAHRRLGNNSVSADGPFEMRVAIENKGVDLVNLQLSEQRFSKMGLLQGRMSAILALPAGAATELRYVLEAKRGVYSWSSIKALASDPFGLFTREVDVPAPGDLLVLPRPMDLRLVHLGRHATKQIAGPFPARVAGAGTDYWGTREYRPGDSLRRLNWRLAARYPGKRYTDEFEREEIADFGVILDTRRLSQDVSAEDALFEHAVSATASLSKLLLKGGNRLSLLAFGRAMISVFPGFGKHHLDRVLRALAIASLGNYIAFDFLKHFPVRLFPSRSQIVIISQLDGRDLDVYARLRGNGYDVLLISPNPVDFGRPRASAAGLRRLSYRLARVERISWLRKVQVMGVKVVDWNVDRPLDTALGEATRGIPHGQLRGRLP